MKACVLNFGDFSNPFQVTNGVKQGCVLAPTLFSTMFAAMFTDSLYNNVGGVNITFRTDSKLFNSKGFPISTRGKVANISNILFADNCS
jgi:hypothetical protein